MFCSQPTPLPVCEVDENIFSNCHNSATVAFATYPQGMTSILLSHTTPAISHHLKVLVDILSAILFVILPVTHHLKMACSRKIVDLAVLTWLGGLRIYVPSVNFDNAYNAFLQVTNPLRKVLKLQVSSIPMAFADQITAKAYTQWRKHEQATTQMPTVRGINSTHTYPPKEIGVGSCKWKRFF